MLEMASLAVSEQTTTKLAPMLMWGAMTKTPVTFFVELATFNYGFDGSRVRSSWISISGRCFMSPTFTGSEEGDEGMVRRSE